MKKNKLVVVISLVVVLIMVIFCIYFFKGAKYENRVCNITDLNEANDVKICTNKFYLYCKEYIDNSPSAVVELLDKDYKKKYNVNDNNIKEKVFNTDSDTLSIESVYKIKQKRNISLYYVSAKKLYKNSDDIKDFNIVLKLDKNNKTFSVFLDDYVRDNNYSDIKIGEKVKVNTKGVKANENNTFDISNTTEYNNIQSNLSNFVTLCIYYKKYAYSLVNKNEEKDTFKSYDEFNQYISDNINSLLNLKVISFIQEDKDGYSQIKVYDNNKFNFVFNTKSYITYDVIIKNK